MYWEIRVAMPSRNRSRSLLAVAALALTVFSQREIKRTALSTTATAAPSSVFRRDGFMDPLPTNITFDAEALFVKRVLLLVILAVLQPHRVHEWQPITSEWL